MASIVSLYSSARTTNSASYISGSFTPSSGDLLVICTVGATTTNTPVVTTTSTGAGGMGFVNVSTARYTTSANIISAFVGDRPANGNTITVSTTYGSDAAAGFILFVGAVRSMTKYGAASVKQTVNVNNQTSANVLEATFGTAVNSTNPTLMLMANLTNPATVTAPTDWTENSDTGFATPTSGAEWNSRDNGFTGTLVSWGSSSGSAWGAIGIEFDSADDPALYARQTFQPYKVKLRTY